MVLWGALDPSQVISFISHDVTLDAMSTLENFPLAAVALG